MFEAGEGHYSETRVGVLGVVEETVDEVGEGGLGSDGAVEFGGVVFRQFEERVVGSLKNRAMSVPTLHLSKMSGCGRVISW